MKSRRGFEHRKARRRGRFVRFSTFNSPYYYYYEKYNPFFPAESAGNSFKEEAT